MSDDLDLNFEHIEDPRLAIQAIHKRLQTVEKAQQTQGEVLHRVVQNTDELLVMIRTTRGIVGFIKALNIVARWITVLGIAIITILTLLTYMKTGKIMTIPSE